MRLLERHISIVQSLAGQMLEEGSLEGDALLAILKPIVEVTDDAVLSSAAP